MNMIKSMLTGRSVLENFLLEVAKWVSYVLNKSPILSVKDITPEKVLSNVKSYARHFRVFGCLTDTN